MENTIKTNENKKGKGLKSKKRNFTPKVWYLTIKNLKSMFRDRAQLAWIIGYPLLFIVLFAVAFNQSPTSPKYSVFIINYDTDGISAPENSYLANASLILVDVLKSKDLKDTITVIDKNYNSKEAEALLKTEELDAVIKIDEKFSEAVYGIGGAKDPKVDITTISDPVVEETITSIVGQIVTQIQLNVNNVSTAEINSAQIKGSVKLTVFDYMYGGFIIAGVTVCVSQLAAHFAEEKEKRTMERLSTTPVSRRDIILSAMFSELVVAIFQIMLMLLIATQAFGAYVNPDANLLLMFSIPLLFAFSCLGIGLLLASFIKTESSASGLSWLIILPMQFLGGIFSYGVEMPLSQFIPTSYAVHAMRIIAINGITSWDALAGDITFLLLFGIISTIIGIILFYRKTAVSKS